MAQDTVVSIPAADVALEADLAVPDGARGIVLFAHGSGSSRHSPRNRMVAERLHQAGLATVLADLLTDEEEAYDRATAALRFDIGLLAERDRKSTRLNSSHVRISYAVFCLKKKK